MNTSRQLETTRYLEGEGSPHTLEDIRERFDLLPILEACKNGELLRWLQERYYEEEAWAVEGLMQAERVSDEELKLDLKHILGVPDGAFVLGGDEERQLRVDRLRAYTDDEEILSQADRVAFDQEELAALLHKGRNPIYLCGRKFTLPVSKKGMTYIGVNEPEVELSGGDCFDELDITVQNVKSKLLSPQWRLKVLRSRLNVLLDRTGIVAPGSVYFIYQCEDMCPACDEDRSFPGRQACRRKAEDVVKEIYRKAERELEKQLDKNRSGGYCDELQSRLSTELSRFVKILRKLRTPETAALIDETAQLLTGSPIVSHMREFSDRLAGECRLPGCQKYLDKIEYEHYDPGEPMEGLWSLAALPFRRYGYSLSTGVLPTLSDDYANAQKTFAEAFRQEARAQIRMRITEPMQARLDRLEDLFSDA